MRKARTDFIGRSAELGVLREQLDEVRESGRGRFVLIRGRRRVGKSTLVEEFLKQENVAHAFFTASRQPAARELELFSEELANSQLQAGEVVRGGTTLESWEAALTLIASTVMETSPAVVVIDEFPYLVESDDTTEALFQKVWDRRLKGVPVLFILIGSDLSMMEALTEYKRPLYNRFSREIVLKPLSPLATGKLLQLSEEEYLDAYLVTGGFPQLADSWKAGVDLWDFLRSSLEDSGSPLIVSGERTLNAEFPTEAHARTVLSVVGTGETTFNNIGRGSDLSTTSLRRALDLLRAKHVIEAAVPFAAKDSTRAKRYIVSDPYLRFWLRFINPNMDLIERGRGKLAYQMVRDSWNDYRGKAIEPIVRDSIERLLPDGRFAEARFVDGFWTRDNLVEVDLVGAQKRRHPVRAAFIGSIKWRENRPFNRTDLRNLTVKAEGVPKRDDETLLVGVSKSGFSTDGLDASLSPKDLIEAWR